MLLNTEGIVLRQTNAPGGVVMLSLFTKKYGKISVGARTGYGGKQRSKLAISPFTLGDYKIFGNRGYYNLDSADVVRSYFGIGEDIEKYAAASLVLEITNRLLVEQDPAPDVFTLLKQFLEMMESRKKSPETLVLAYEIKLLKKLGYFPILDQCVECGTHDHLNFFSVSQGGAICTGCGENKPNSLIYDTEFGIIENIKYFEKTRFRDFQKIALKQKDAGKLQQIIRDYLAYHLEVTQLLSDNISVGLFAE
ncbi:DNA repair protein RecO [Eubacteriales bacterium KG125]